MKIRVGLQSTDFPVCSFGVMNAEEPSIGGDGCVLRHTGDGWSIIVRTNAEVEAHDVTASIGAAEWVYFDIHWKTDGTFICSINGEEEFTSTTPLITEEDLFVLFTSRVYIYPRFVNMDIDHVTVNAADDDYTDEVITADPDDEEDYASYVTCVHWDEYLYELKHAIDFSEKGKIFPDKLLLEWTDKDIEETVLRLGGILNHRYRKTATVALPDAVGATFSGISHASGAVNVTGFSGLTVDEYVNCVIMCVVSDVFYTAGIKSNTIDTVVLDNGGELPVISAGIVFTSKIAVGGAIDLLSLRGFENGDRVWSVIGANSRPIPSIPVNLSRNIQNMSDYDNSVYWYQLGDQLNFVVGADTIWSGLASIGFYKLPTAIIDENSCIDLPIEYQGLAQQRTKIRMLFKLANDKEAALESKVLQAQFLRIEKGVMSMRNIDWLFREIVS